MRITKKQLAVITVLNLIIAALIGLIVWLNIKTPAKGDDGDGDSTNTVTPPDPPQHVKLRDATAGKVKEIERETRLMGSGDESIVYSHTLGGVTYIFGNATVHDLDFDTSGGFLCRIDGNGRMLGYTYFTGNITAVGLIEGGFGAATVADIGGENERCELMGVDFDGKATLISELDGSAADVISVGSKKLAVVTFPTEKTVKLTEFTRAGDGWAAGASTRISSGLSVQYFDTYAIGGSYIISGRAYSGTRYDALVFYKFTAGGDETPYYYGGEGDSMLTPYAVQPFNNGFLAVCKRNGEAAVVTVEDDFKSFRRDMLGIKVDQAFLSYSSGKYYACFVGDDGTVTYELDDRLNRSAVGALDGAVIADTLNMDGTLFVAYTDRAVVITDGGEHNASLDISGAKINRAFKLGHNNFLLTLTARGGDALSSPSGGADAYLIAVKL